MTAWDLYWITLGLLVLAVGALVWICRRVYLWVLTGRWERRRRRKLVLTAALRVGGLRLGRMVRHLYEPEKP